MQTAGNTGPGATLRSAAGLVFLVVVLGTAIFLARGTVRFVEGWTFLATFSCASAMITAYLARNDPALLARRTQAGPIAEQVLAQKVIQAFATLAFLGMVVVPGLDRRWGWSHPPALAVIGGHFLVALGFYVVFCVFRENTFTSGTIEVAEDQRVVDTGPYAIVRHPMYAGALVLIAGMPLALGSLVGLLGLPFFVAVLVARLLDEERYLRAHLTGYAEFCETTPFRLVPRIW